MVKNNLNDTLGFYLILGKRVYYPRQTDVSYGWCWCHSYINATPVKPVR